MSESIVSSHWLSVSDSKESMILAFHWCPPQDLLCGRHERVSDETMVCDEKIQIVPMTIEEIEWLLKITGPSGQSVLAIFSRSPLTIRKVDPFLRSRYSRCKRCWLVWWLCDVLQMIRIVILKTVISYPFLPTLGQDSPAQT